MFGSGLEGKGAFLEQKKLVGFLFNHSITKKFAERRASCDWEKTHDESAGGELFFIWIALSGRERYGRGHGRFLGQRRLSNFRPDISSELFGEEERKREEVERSERLKSALIARKR